KEIRYTATPESLFGFIFSTLAYFATDADGSSCFTLNSDSSKRTNRVGDSHFLISEPSAFCRIFQMASASTPFFSVSASLASLSSYLQKFGTGLHLSFGLSP